MPRRSPSPEGVGDLLRESSFVLSDDEIDNGVDDQVETYEEPQKPRLKSVCIVVPPRDTDPPKHEPIPFPKSKTSKKRRSSSKSKKRRSEKDREARYFVMKTIHEEDVEKSVRSGVWRTQVFSRNPAKYKWAYNHVDPKSASLAFAWRSFRHRPIYSKTHWISSAVAQWGDHLRGLQAVWRRHAYCISKSDQAFPRLCSGRGASFQT